ncbi:amidase domain-containing protein [Populibacterium corticicola]|uniref:amidase domain-containing protein n=1 Tax=Populibacterium corticicola TaxID=1812826 RepID=UPI0036718148
MKQAESDAISDVITTVIGAAYDVIPSEVEVKLEGSSDLTLSAEVVPADQVVDSIDEEIDLSVSAQADVEEIAYAVATEHDPSNLPDGIQPDLVENVEVSDTTIDATKDSTDGSLIVESQTLVKKTYETGVVGESLIETVVIFDDDGEIVSFKELTSEDYANQADIDSGTATTPYEDDPGSSEYGEPLNFSGLLGESTSQEGEDVDILSSAEDSGFVTAQASFNGGGILPAKLLAAEKKRVADYAIRWSLMRNSAYRDYGTENCTNFISQALNAGGWKHVSGAETSVKAWWYTKDKGTNRKKDKTSTSWVNAEDWYRFARNESKRARIITNLNSVVVGDIIQIKYENKKRMNHSMVVTKKVGTKVYLSYNSVDRLNKPLSELLATYKGASFFAHGI